MRQYVNNSSHPSFVYIHRNPSLPDIETILNGLLLLHHEALTLHHHRQCEYRICSSLLALCKDVNDHSMRQYVNNSCHHSFAYIHRNPSLPDIQTILNVPLWLQNVALSSHYHHQYEYRIFCSLLALRKDVNDHSMRQYVNNSSHLFFVYIIHSLFLTDIETILDALSLLHKEVRTIHHH